ncbi:hypothetical protein BIZ83_gp089 [Erwinia phage vB_EamM_ChrisDB]|uniref:hypothetical protein n=1 Tax=Erwinia phage vB_EamM_ChrisDB TaxID=1883371 RepID=UPI00081CBFCA|nr:hypothetical protein BIZ83_gp089 [Erwinia phage vB_EamM_ChrisDB]ANZ48764.1 hypothetical protein CHRISDB_202 [Erwinia phage vB_EamM_ChrisDB]
METIMEVVSVNAVNKELMRYRIITCNTDIGDVKQVLLFPEGMVGTLGPLSSFKPLCCSMLITELTPPYETHRLNVKCGKYVLN